MASMAGTDDPFRDPRDPLAATNAPSQPQERMSVPDTLDVRRNAPLTLGTDSLIVLDEALLDTKTANCCGLSLAGSKHPRNL